jgi:NAD(P)-dependent dehydrogenase (short-subunit alcohol dehydrogenase family)
MDFPGTVSVVTGAASGIGRACALAFAREGSDVVVADLNDSTPVAEEIEALGRKALVVRSDVGKRQDCEALVDESIAWQGHVDLFHSNAGVGGGGSPHKMPLEDWEWIMNINLWAHIWTIRKILPHMIERRSGHLVHTASSAGTLGFASLVPYCVTKFGVVGLCESLATYCVDKGIGVSVICPLLVATNITDNSRSTPEEPVAPEVEAQLKEAARAFMATGLPPDSVAEDVVDAVKNGHLYVFPHPELKGMIAAKWQDPDAWVRNAAAMWQAQQQMMQQAIAGATVGQIAPT